uniref:DNA (cytosine-5-)-methyltransferase n=1 Tax=Skeletonema marinoi TaxID=267567 RepID=A0A7S2LD16_9STRA|mmetsp:Transcript_23833/g.40580  ORF Transcript_23833/g.40580 Transcript_23833/m.40580 type:complete len:1002 (+) Transcript_23833:139-3144(+)
MDQSDNKNNDNSRSLIDDSSRPVEDDGGRKRKRDNLSASSSQHGGEETTQNTAMQPTDSLGEESREQQTASQQRVIEEYQQLNELLLENRKLLLENRQLRIELSERDGDAAEKDREIEELRGELEREKQRRLKSDDGSQSNDVTAPSNGGMVTSAVSEKSVKYRGTTSNTSTEFDESTDEEVQLSSNSSMDRRLRRQLNDANDDAEAGEGDVEGNVSSVKTKAISYFQLYENGDDDEEGKEVGGEGEDEQRALADSGTTRSLETNLGSHQRANDSEGEDEQNHFEAAEYAAAIRDGEYLHGDISSDGQPPVQDESTAANPTSKETTTKLIGNDVNVGAGDGGGVEVEDDIESFATKKASLKMGMRLAIYWPDDNKHYNGTLQAYDAVAKKYYVKYDDGEADWEDLEKETYHILDDHVPFGDIAAGADAELEEEEESDDEVVQDGGRLAFCCQNCTCNNSETPVNLYSCVNSGSRDSIYGNIHLFHKGCCHNERGDVNTFKTPMQVNMEKGIFGKREHVQECSLTTIKDKHRNAMREETRVANEEFMAAEDSKIYASPVYAAHCKTFQQRKGTQISPLRVLELFSGIGSGTLALKKLRIPLDTVVHCDHDPIANEVCRFNHQRDGIKHVCIDTFEEIYGEGSEPDEYKVAKLVDDHGPFDLVLAGAPCSNYSGLNATKDASCANAQYLPNVGKLIAKLNSIQKKHGMKHGVLFLSENVVFKDFDDISQCYGKLEPIRLDAKDFSPCKRSRFYWCNIPVDTEKYTNVASQVSVDYGDILDPGSGLLERLVYDCDEHFTVKTVKANTFLASLSKIDDDRMLKCSTGDCGRTNIKLEHYSVGERERMMGFPPSYVSKPLQNLFNEITTCAILQPETSADGKTYRDFMDKRFWHLRKKLKLSHYAKSEEPYFEIGIATPIENKQKLAFFTEEQYSKHLIGMGFSVCVVEALLEGLVDLFAKDLLRTYEGCDYSFPWEPYLSNHRERQKEDESATQSANEERQMRED